MGWWPCCCGTADVCTDCCDDEAEDYVVDLGAGGLTDDECDNCEAIAGEFTVSKITFDGDDCHWRYSEEEWCDGCVLNHDLGDCEPLRLTVNLWLKVDDVGRCYWEAMVSFGSGCVDPPEPDDLDTFCGGGAGGSAIYESAHDIADCSTLPITLTKQSEEWFANCSGSLPSTVALEAAP